MTRSNLLFSKVLLPDRFYLPGTFGCLYARIWLLDGGGCLLPAERDIDLDFGLLGRLGHGVWSMS